MIPGIVLDVHSNLFWSSSILLYIHPRPGWPDQNVPMTESVWLLGGAAVLAGAIASVSGFGIGSLLTPLLMLSMPATHAVAVLALPHAWATGIRLVRLR